MGDWLEAKKNILSITVEIGDKSKTSKSFYPNKSHIFNILDYTNENVVQFLFEFINIFTY